MPAKTSDELSQLFIKALNAGDLDALVELYEPGAAMVPEPGKPVAGLPAVRAALAGFLAMKARLSMTSRTIAKTEDLLLRHSDWTLSGTGADGKPMEMKGNAIEVLRKQTNGAWLYAIDAPFGQ